MIHCIATIELAPGSRDAWLAEFKKLVPQVLQEPGCIEYGPAIDLTTGLPPQPPLRNDVVTVVEKWKDLDSLKAHLAAPLLGEFRERVKPMLRGLTLHVLEPQ